MHPEPEEASASIAKIASSQPRFIPNASGSSCQPTVAWLELGICPALSLHYILPVDCNPVAIILITLGP